MSDSIEAVPPQEFEFDTSSLYSREGFESGDLLRIAFPHLNPGDTRSLLVEVVQRHVLPKLDQNVQTTVVPSVHNPLRATSVNGAEVVWTTPASGRGPVLTPSRIKVPYDDILAAARRLRLPVASPTVN